MSASPATLAALARWAADPATLRPVGAFENEVHAFARGGTTCFLRLVSSEHRTREQVEAELDFVAWLHGAGLDVAAPVPSLRGALVEEIVGSDGASRWASVFGEVVGEDVRARVGPLGPAHFALRGETLGRLHALARQFTPGRHRRFAWHEDSVWRAAPSLTADDPVAARELDALHAELAALPAGADDVGLIHGDVGPTNFRERAGRLALFDFDDCSYHWLAYDLAVTLYPHGRRQDRLALRDATFDGYARVAPVSGWWPDAFTLLCRMRLLYMYLAHARRWSGAPASPEQRRWLDDKRAAMASPIRWS